MPVPQNLLAGFFAAVPDERPSAVSTPYRHPCLGGGAPLTCGAARATVQFLLPDEMLPLRSCTGGRGQYRATNVRGFRCGARWAAGCSAMGGAAVLYTTETHVEGVCIHDYSSIQNHDRAAPKYSRFMIILAAVYSNS